MNRIILIGNGFDLAHGLPTSYTQFIDKLWVDIIGKIKQTNAEHYSDNYIEIKKNSEHVYSFFLENVVQSVKTYKELQNCLKEWSLTLTIKNQFLARITASQQSFKNWVDIEDEYYKLLLLCSDNTYNSGWYGKIKILNANFNHVKQSLHQYLTDLMYEYKIDLKPISLIDNIVKAPFYDKDFVIKRDFNDKDILNKKPESQLFLNFNYTNLEKYYTDGKNDFNSIIHIHGSINDKANPIIFGYGDELDDNYKKIEKLKNNEYLENVKSIKYLETDNYKRLLSFINSDYYQIVILGHSCGNSDRTLLNTLFEHENCVSIKPFYYKSSTGDNYSDIVRNISRHFTNKSVMREKIVNKRDCEPFSIEN